MRNEEGEEPNGRNALVRWGSGGIGSLDWKEIPRSELIFEMPSEGILYSWFL